MEFFIDGWSVRLKSRLHGTYLYADEDGVGVSMRPRRASLNAAWMVEHLERDGTNYALLRGAAYGRYLAFEPAQPAGSLCCRIVQRDYDDSEQDDVLWEVVRAGAMGGDVLIRNGGHPPGYLSVVVDNDDNPTVHWMVDVLLPRLEPPVLKAPIPLPGVKQPGILIWYVLADDLGDFEQNNWAVHLFFGRSVYNLRRDLAAILGVADNEITLCVRAGSQGRLTHLVIDLPSGEDFFEIVVLRTQSTADLRLWHPDVDRP